MWIEVQECDPGAGPKTQKGKHKINIGRSLKTI